MANQKVSDLTLATTINPADLLMVVDDPVGTPLSKKTQAKDVVLGATIPSGSKVLLYDYTVESGESLLSLDLTDIPQDFDDLILLARYKTDGATLYLSRVFFNGDTTAANYFTQEHFMYGTTRSGSEASDPYGPLSIGDGGISNAHGFGRILIPNYSTSGNMKQYFSRAYMQYAAADVRLYLAGVVWEDGPTDPITRITVYPSTIANAYNFVPSTRIRLIGVKA